jgi:hypothetical protein
MWIDDVMTWRTVIPQESVTVEIEDRGRRRYVVEDPIVRGSECFYWAIKLLSKERIDEFLGISR